MIRFLLILLAVSSVLGQGQFSIVPFPWTTSVTTGNHLAPDALAYWRFEETSGNALDSSGNGRTLTENGTIGSTVDGVVANARTYAADDETDYFERASESVFGFSGDFTITAWVLLDNSFPDIDDKTIISRGDFAGSNFSWFLEFDNAGISSNFRFYWSTTGNFDGGNFVESVIGIASESAYYFVVVRRTGNTLHVSATYQGDPLTSDTTGTSSGTYFEDGTSTLRVGDLEGSDIHDMRGNIDEMGVWSRYLSDCEVAWLYTARNGTFTWPSFDSNTCADPPAMLLLDWDTEEGALEWDTEEGAPIQITN